MNRVALSSLVRKLESGARPKGGATVESGEIPSLGGEHLGDDGRLRLTSLKRIPRTFFQSLDKGRIERNDILIVKDGATTGKVCFVDDSFRFDDAAINEHVFRLQVDADIADSRYVFWFLFSEEGQRQIQLDYRGSTVGGIGRTVVDKVHLPLPPLAEQRRIAAILDKADALRAKRREAIAKLDQLLQSVFLDMFGDPVTNPKGWSVRTLAELCRSISDIDHKMPVAVEDGLPFISAKDLTDDGRISFENVKRISEEDFRRLSRKSKPEKGDIIYSRIGVNLGKARIVEVEFPFLASYSCCTIKPNEELVDTNYLCSLLDSPFTLMQAHKGVRAIAVPDLGLGEIKAFKIVMPPVSLQRTFSKRVAAVDELKTAQRTSLTQLDALTTALQHRTFSGAP